jgi:quercetin dioxygenase-like cupin family protein
MSPGPGGKADGGGESGLEYYEVEQEELEWVPADFQRAYMKVLYMDQRGGGQVLLVRYEPFCEMPAHAHRSADEAAYVLEGSIKLASRDEDAPFRRAGYFAFFPAGVEHGPFSTGEEPCTIISFFNGPLK